MSELKYYKLFHRASALTSPEFISVVEFGTDDEIYLKSEADKVIAELKTKLAIAQIVLRLNEPKALYSNSETMSRLSHKIDVVERRERHQKYKRCLAMAKWCDQVMMSCELQGYNVHRIWARKHEWAMRWKYKWLELAEKFKEVQND